MFDFFRKKKDSSDHKNDRNDNVQNNPENAREYDQPEEITRKTHDGETVTIRIAPGARERFSGIDLDALLYDVGGVLPEDAGTEPSDVWTVFDRMSEAERAQALNHSFKLESHRIGVGWEYPAVTLDGENYRYRVSYIGPSVRDFVNLVKKLVMARTLISVGRMSLDITPGAWRDVVTCSMWKFPAWKKVCISRINTFVIRCRGKDTGWRKWFF